MSPLIPSEAALEAFSENHQYIRQNHQRCQVKAAGLELPASIFDSLSSRLPVKATRPQGEERGTPKLTILVTIHPWKFYAATWLLTLPLLLLGGPPRFSLRKILLAMLVQTIIIGFVSYVVVTTSVWGWLPVKP